MNITTLSAVQSIPRWSHRSLTACGNVPKIALVQAARQLSNPRSWE